jgi:formylglycine-generating enzyme required for sulfatase activity
MNALHVLLAVAIYLSAAALAQAASPLPEDMVRIQGGPYALGSDTGPRDARPRHTVTLRDFLIDRFEVTNAQFAVFLNTLQVQPVADAAAGEVRRRHLSGADAYRLLEGAEGFERDALYALDDDQARIEIRQGRFQAALGYENHPVAETTWAGAAAFCVWRGARLPTEAEWEAAARGKESRTYPWGEQVPTAERAVMGRSSGQTLPVGSRVSGATPEGIHDLSGSLQEWTSSLYRPYPYNAQDGREDAVAKQERVTRGGDYVFDTEPGRMTGLYRTGFSRDPGRGHRHIGFRCVR